jgi:hypothetical protein
VSAFRILGILALAWLLAPGPVLAQPAPETLYAAALRAFNPALDAPTHLRTRTA